MTSAQLESNEQGARGDGPHGDATPPQTKEEDPYFKRTSINRTQQCSAKAPADTHSKLRSTNRAHLSPIEDSGDCQLSGHDRMSTGIPDIPYMYQRDNSSLIEAYIEGINSSDIQNDVNVTGFQALHNRQTIQAFTSRDFLEKDSNGRMRPSPKFCILSVDGGGIKGVIPAALIVQLEYCLRREAEAWIAAAREFFQTNLMGKFGAGVQATKGESEGGSFSGGKEYVDKAMQHKLEFLQMLPDPAELSKRLAEINPTKLEVRNFFHLMAGTSTGSLIVSKLALHQDAPEAPVATAANKAPGLAGKVMRKLNSTVTRSQQQAGSGLKRAASAPPLGPLSNAGSVNSEVDDCQSEADRNKPQTQAQEVYQIYLEQGKIIFGKKVVPCTGSCGNLCGCLYPLRNILKYVRYGGYMAKDLEQVLSKHLNYDAKATEIPCVIPAFNISKNCPVLFVTGEYDNSKELCGKQLTLKDICQASAAAPTYLPPKRLVDKRGDFYVDGGLYANNPLYYAMVWPLTHREELGKLGMSGRSEQALFEKVMVLSLGTGSSRRERKSSCLRLNSPEHWGMASWAKPVIDGAMDGTSIATHETLAASFAQVERMPAYLRIQPRLKRGMDKLDDAKRAVMANMVYSANKQLASDSLVTGLPSTGGEVAKRARLKLEEDLRRSYQWSTHSFKQQNEDGKRAAKEVNAARLAVFVQLLAQNWVTRMAAQAYADHKINYKLERRRAESILVGLENGQAEVKAFAFAKHVLQLARLGRLGVKMPPLDDKVNSDDEEYGAHSDQELLTLRLMGVARRMRSLVVDKLDFSNLKSYMDLDKGGGASQLSRPSARDLYGSENPFDISRIAAVPTRLQLLNLSNLRLRKLPSWVSGNNLKELRAFTLAPCTGFNAEKLRQLENLTTLRSLDISGSSVECIRPRLEETISAPPSVVLSFTDHSTHYHTAAEAGVAAADALNLVQLKQLRVLRVSGSPSLREIRFARITESSGYWRNLLILDVSACPMFQLPNSLRSVPTSLTELYCAHTSLALLKQVRSLLEARNGSSRFQRLTVLSCGELKTGINELPRTQVQRRRTQFERVFINTSGSPSESDLLGQEGRELLTQGIPRKVVKGTMDIDGGKSSELGAVLVTCTFTDKSNHAPADKSSIAYDSPWYVQASLRSKPSRLLRLGQCSQHRPGELRPLLDEGKLIRGRRPSSGPNANPDGGPVKEAAETFATLLRLREVPALQHLHFGDRVVLQVFCPPGTHVAFHEAAIWPILRSELDSKPSLADWL